MDPITDMDGVEHTGQHPARPGLGGWCGYCQRYNRESDAERAAQIDWSQFAR